MLDWSVVLCFIGLIVILGLSVILYYKQVKSTKEMNKKLNSLVDQINKSNLYEYKFDTEQNGNIKNNDQNITNLNNVFYKSQNLLISNELKKSSERKDIENSAERKDIDIEKEKTKQAEESTKQAEEATKQSEAAVKKAEIELEMMKLKIQYKL